MLDVRGMLPCVKDIMDDFLGADRMFDLREDKRAGASHHSGIPFHHG